MKLLFAGPSLYGAQAVPPGIVRRPPASQGDVQSAVLQGATVIGLVDGLFETVAAVWHKEILFALSHGVAVLGAASLGALRAAECGPYGMIAVGEVARRYVSGELDDDAAVAQLHAPAELNFLPVTEALVDCESKVEALLHAGRLDPGEATALLSVARNLFFKERTWSVILAVSGLSRKRAVTLLPALKSVAGSVKHSDALELVERMMVMPDGQHPSRPHWKLSETPAWKRSLSATSAEPVPGPGGSVGGKCAAVTVQ